MRKINFQKEAKKAFSVEIQELLAFSKSKSFDVNRFCQAIFECKGKVFLTGVGKSGHIANKISADNLKAKRSTSGNLDSSYLSKRNDNAPCEPSW